MGEWELWVRKDSNHGWELIQKGSKEELELLYDMYASDYEVMITLPVSHRDNTN